MHPHGHIVELIVNCKEKITAGACVRFHLSYATFVLDPEQFYKCSWTSLVPF